MSLYRVVTLQEPCQDPGCRYSGPTFCGTLFDDPEASSGWAYHKLVEVDHDEEVVLMLTGPQNVRHS